MPSENPNYIKDFDLTVPDGSLEHVNIVDDILRDIKKALKQSFPNVNAACNATPTEFNRLVGIVSALVTVAAAQTITGVKEFQGNNVYRGAFELVQGARNYAIATGTDTYFVTYTPALAAYVTGAEYRIRIPNANTSTTPTLSINGLGNKTIVTSLGTALTVGALFAGGEYTFRYDGANMRLLGPASPQGLVLSAYATNTSSPITIPSTGGTGLLVSLNLGTVNVGDIIRLQAGILYNKGATQGRDFFYISKESGTAVVDMLASGSGGYSTIEAFTGIIPANSSANKRQIAGRFIATTAGTLTLSLRAAAEGSDGSVNLTGAAFLQADVYRTVG